MRHPRLLPLLACAVFNLAACQQANDSEAEGGAGRVGSHEVGAQGNGGQGRGPANVHRGAMEMHAGASLPLPADFPSDVYLPGRYEVNSVMDMGGMQVVSVTTRGRVADVHGQAQQRMEATGWTQTLSMQHSADNAMLAYEKGGRTAVLSFNRGEGGDGVVMGVQLRAREP